jgi:hypothetical protein
MDSLLNTRFAFNTILQERKSPLKVMKVINVKSWTAAWLNLSANIRGNYFLSQDIDKLNWIISNPWVTTWPGNDVIDYPFSYEVQSFSQHFLVIRKDGEIRARIIISMRDNHVTLPFYYGSTRWINEVAGILKEHI